MIDIVFGILHHIGTIRRIKIDAETYWVLDTVIGTAVSPDMTSVVYDSSSASMP